MKFNEYKYEHLDLEKIKKEFSELIESFEKAENYLLDQGYVKVE